MAEQNVQPKLATKPRIGSALQAKMDALEKTLSEGATTEASRMEDVEPPFPKPSALRCKPAETPGNRDTSTFTFPRPPVLKPPVNAVFNNKAKVFPAPGSPPWKEHQSESTAVSPNLPNVPKPKLPGVPKLPDAFKLPGVPKLPDAPKPKLPDASKPKTSSTSPLQASQSAQSAQFQKPSLIFIPKSTTCIPYSPPSQPQNYFSKEQSVTGSFAALKDVLRTLNPSTSVIPTPLTTQKPKSGTPDEPFPLTERMDPSLPKKKPLPNMFSLPPQKPNRPPHVDLRLFQENGVSLNDGPCNTTGCLQTKASNGVHSFAMSPPVEQEWSSDDDNYEDIDEVVQPTPCLPSRVPPTGGFSAGHLSQQIEAECNDGEDTYDYVDERWPELKTIETNITKEIKKKDKKQLQQEKKLQEANEKREQAAKKTFKIKGPVQVLHEATALLDCRPKEGKTHLSLKKGETIEIIRITDNPKGRWLARNTDGCYGYVKTDSIDSIDSKDRLKQFRSNALVSTTSSEIYDDIGAQSDFSSDAQGQNSEDDDDYVQVEDECCPPPPPPPPAPIGYGGFPPPLSPPPPLIGYGGFPPPLSPPPPMIYEGYEDDFYDDVGSQDCLPPPPLLNCLPQSTTKGKIEVMDPQKKKKFDKEEKAFRKRFKFEGKIQVLYSVTIATTLTNKKLGNKDLPLNPEEEIDVIQEAVDGKLIGRNRDGKFGYVALVNVEQHNDDIYDDIGEECVYDN